MCISKCIKNKGDPQNTSLPNYYTHFICAFEFFKMIVSVNKTLINS